VLRPTKDLPVVGLYIAQISMTCLLALKIATTSDNAIFIAEVVLMVLLILLTFGAQVFIRHTFERKDASKCLDRQY
jgi:hypothetical protein